MNKQSNSNDGHLLSEIYALLAKDESSCSIIELIENKSKEYNISQRQISEAIGIQRKSLQRILEGEAQKIDVLTFLKISQFLGTDLEKLVQMYVAGLPVQYIKDVEKARKAGFILRNFDLDSLKKLGLIESSVDFDHIESRILRRFSLNSIYEYSTEVAAPLFSRTKRNFSDQMVKLWIGSAYQQFKTINNPNDFDKETLFKIIPRIRAFSRDYDNGLVQVCRALFSIGVTVIIQSYLRKIQVRGATFLVNGKPCIVLSDFNKRYDELWTTLMHELYHVMKDLDLIARMGYHTTKSEGQMVVDHVSEEKADGFAREFLLPADKRKYIKSFIDVPAMVEGYAEKWNIHPSIIYGLHLEENKDDYPKYRRMILKTNDAIKSFLVYDLEDAPLNEVAEKLKEQVYLNS